MSSGFDPNSVRKVKSVEAPQDVARQVFTDTNGNLVAIGHIQDR
jgi:hypothetical protein